MIIIHQLRADLAAREAELAALRAGLADLRAYLTSEKFYPAPTPIDSAANPPRERQDLVNPQDVLLRLDEADRAMLDARIDARYAYAGPARAESSAHGWQCPACQQLLELPDGKWQWTDAAARDAMFNHWRDAHVPSDAEQPA